MVLIDTETYCSFGQTKTIYSIKLTSLATWGFMLSVEAYNWDCWR